MQGLGLGIRIWVQGLGFGIRKVSVEGLGIRFGV